MHHPSCNSIRTKLGIYGMYHESLWDLPLRCSSFPLPYVSFALLRSSMELGMCQVHAMHNYIFKNKFPQTLDTEVLGRQQIPIELECRRSQK